MQDLNDKTTGSFLLAPEWNQVPSEIQNVIEGLGQTLSSGDLNQLGKGIAGYVANSNFYADGGAADAYVLSAVGSKQVAPSYADGFSVTFIAGNTNTGASTVNVAGLGVKNIKLSGGSDPKIGDISGRVELVFDASSDWFELRSPLAGPPGAVDQTQKIMAALQADIGDVIALVVGDSTGDETTEWIHLLLEDLALQFPTYTFEWRVWNVGLKVYDAAVTISTGTGANTLTLHNASIPGEEATFVKGEIYDPITDVQADLTIVSFGHNGLTDPENQRTELAAFTCRMADDYPDRPIILIGQNPRTDNETMAPKVREFRELAAEQGYGFIDVHSAFKKFAIPLASFMTDTVHPNALGSELWKNTVIRSFVLAEQGGSGLPRNSMGETLIYAAVSDRDFKNWDNTGITVTTESASGFYETNSASAKLVSAGAGNLRKDVVTSDDIVRWRGKWVTVAARVRVPDGEVSDTGLLALFDGVNTVLSFTGGPQGTDFYWQVVSIKVDASATSIRPIIYTDRGATGGTMYLDRLTIISGRAPKDFIIPEFGQHIRTTEGFDVFGSNPDGLVVVHNNDADGSDYAFVFLSEIDGSPTDDPRTQYSISVGCDLIKMKRRADAADRLRINPRTGGLLMGDGTVTPPIVFEPNGNNLIKTDKASIYSDSSNTFDLGLSNKLWRRVHAGEIQLNAGPKWLSGSGSPEGVVTADVGSVFSRTDGGAGTSFYVKESGTGNTGWVAK